MSEATVTISESLRSPVPALNFEAYWQFDSESHIHNLCQRIEADKMFTTPQEMYET